MSFLEENHGFKTIANSTSWMLNPNAKKGNIYFNLFLFPNYVLSSLKRRHIPTRSLYRWNRFCALTYAHSHRTPLSIRRKQRTSLEEQMMDRTTMGWRRERVKNASCLSVVSSKIVSVANRRSPSHADNKHPSPSPAPTFY
nr:hypothetical protein BgiMline_002525 [Biomphalaria glabrata]